ncbi:hypothetical protein PMPD1_4441 (plasmid) [Paramixta manurensis]|uniref:DUF1380 domain-containing protein n=1 Tax=Paramixta manurensis TaxID=2740817 RepID=A0A6M8UHH4_9GAMM|nr:hypothetical protein PMPD1_4441 [Erwiniaceae bacterium PD-1]
MYGTRKELTRELKRMFAAAEPLAILVWTADSVSALAEASAITEDEAERVLAEIGAITMDDHQAEGVSVATVRDLLAGIREAGGAGCPGRRPGLLKA